MNGRKTLIALWIAVLFALTLIGAAMLSCGTQSDMVGGITNWPVNGTKPWGKVDLDLSIVGLQDFILYSPPGFIYTEPCLVRFGGYFWLYFERRAYEVVEGYKQPKWSDICIMRSADGLTWEIYNDGGPVMRATESWEDGYVGAPTVIPDGDHLVMWYSGGIGRGIGTATSEDGMTWTKAAENPVMGGDQVWEQGFVGAPSVISHNHLYRMYYSGGLADETPFSQFAGRLIGYADSPDGITWTKRDAQARNSEDDPGEVLYVLEASQWWEGYDIEEGTPGGVASPSVYFQELVDRNVVLMYYTGDVIGDPVLHPNSIGVAGTYDYNEFTKATTEVNPIVDEKFTLTLYGISEYLSMSESAPTVIPLSWDRFVMVFSQTDALSETGDSGRGLAIAVCPPFGSNFY